jgi:hypothetical protein
MSPQYRHVRIVGDRPMKVATDNTKKTSPYLSAGAPTKCFLPSCRQRFDDRAVHGQDGQYYCSEACCNEARESGLSQVQELPRKSA